MPPSSVVVHCKSCTAHCPQAARQCIAGVALPTAPKQCGIALQEFDCPLSPGTEVVRCSSSAAHSLQAVRHCPLPTAHKCSAAGHTQCSAVHSTKQYQAVPSSVAPRTNY